MPSSLRKNLNWFWTFLASNVVIAFCISLLYLSTPSTRPDNILAGLFTIPYFLGHFGLIFIVLCFPFLLLFILQSFLKPEAQILRWILGIFLAFLQTLLLVDTFVFQQYRFHINMFVLDLFFNGQGQVISFSWYLWAMVYGFLALVAAFEIWMSYQILKKTPVTSFRRTSLVIGLWFFLLLSSHIGHAIADAFYYRPITKMGTIPPFPAPLNAQDTLKKYGLIDVDSHKSTSLMSLEDETASLVQYPLEEMKCAGPTQKMNVLFIMLDSVRYDMLNSIVMPHSFKIAQQSLVFNQHFSGSNSTRGGVFSFFYGLPPLYFDRFRETHTGPVLMDQFQKNNYELKILGSAPLTKPEFDQTIFSKVQNLRKKSKASAAFERDQEITDEFLEFTANRNKNQNFFSFLFYDSAHEFSYAEKYLKFEPYLKDINYFTLNNSTDPTLFLNRYKNSVYYIDVLLGQVFEGLKKQNLDQNTIIVFSSDHGKEFNDNKLNYWGHNSNFTNAQTHVPFFIYWPGRKDMVGQVGSADPNAMDHWTAHYDVAPTFMEEFFNCSNPPMSFSSGENMIKGSGHKWILHGTYGDFGIRLNDHFIVIKTAGSYEILDLHYRPVENIAVDYETYNKALKEMRRFYK